MTAKEFASSWLEAWNNHDIEGVLAHFADDVEVTTPMIRIATGRDQDTLYGKEALRDYWTTALAKFPDLHFELLRITEGVRSIALYYHTVMNKSAIEVMFLNDDGLVRRMDAFYSIASD